MSVCFLCQSEEAFETCDKCESVAWCGREHAKAHFRVSDGACLPFKIERRPLKGNVMVATRKIVAPEVILEELPAVSGPDNRGRLTCVQCQKPWPPSRATEEAFPTCNMCGFPVCDDECEHCANVKMSCVAKV